MKNWIIPIIITLIIGSCCMYQGIKTGKREVIANAKIIIPDK